MDFKELAYVIAIAEHQNITKAANSLYLSQPTLTKFMQNLEKSMGQKLFRKVGNKFLLTYAGERYVDRGQQILQLKRELDVEMADIIKSNIGSLNISFPAVRGTYLLPCTLPPFKNRHPNVQINVLEASSAEIEKMLLAGTTDVAFFNAPYKNPEIAYEIINTEEILLVMSPNHPKAGCGVKKKGCNYPWIDLKSLKDEMFIIQKPEQRTRQIVDLVLKDAGIAPINPLVTSNIAAGVELTSQNYGIAFVCETHLKYMNLDDKLVKFSCGHPSVTIDFVAAYRKGAYLSYHAREYITIVKDLT